MGEIEPAVTNRTSKHFGFSLFYHFIVIGVLNASSHAGLRYKILLMLTVSM